MQQMAGVIYTWRLGRLQDVFLSHDKTNMVKFALRCALAASSKERGVQNIQREEKPRVALLTRDFAKADLRGNAPAMLPTRCLGDWSAVAIAFSDALDHTLVQREDPQQLMSKTESISFV